MVGNNVNCFSNLGFLPLGNVKFQKNDFVDFTSGLFEVNNHKKTKENEEFGENILILKYQGQNIPFSLI